MVTTLIQESCIEAVFYLIVALRTTTFGTTLNSMSSWGVHEHLIWRFTSRLTNTPNCALWLVGTNKIYKFYSFSSSGKKWHTHITLSMLKFLLLLCHILVTNINCWLVQEAPCLLPFPKSFPVVAQLLPASFISSPTWWAIILPQLQCCVEQRYQTLWSLNPAIFRHYFF